MGRHAAVGYHITMRLQDDHGVARSRDALRIASRLLVRHGDSRGLLAHRVADTHVHVLLQCDRETAGQFARVVESALQQVLKLPVPFERARIRPLQSPKHLANALRYVLVQEDHHGTCFDRSHEGSSVQDLLGMRLLPGDRSTQRLSQLLPRLTRQEVLSWIGAEGLDEVAPDPTHAAEAALATLGLTSFAGRTRASVAARRLLAQSCGVTALPETLRGINPRTARQLRAVRVEPRLAKAMAMQLRYRTLLATG